MTTSCFHVLLPTLLLVSLINAASPTITWEKYHGPEDGVSNAPRRAMVFPRFHDTDGDLDINTLDVKINDIYVIKNGVVTADGFDHAWAIHGNTTDCNVDIKLKSDPAWGACMTVCAYIEDNEANSVRDTITYSICEQPAQTTIPGPPASGRLRIVTFNIEKLGTRNDPPRTTKDIQNIAARMSDMDAAVFALQEIENSDAFTSLFNNMTGNWSKYYNKGPSFLWNTDKVTLIGSIEKLTPYPGGRDPITAIFQDKDARRHEFRLINVHADPRNETTRSNQLAYCRDKVCDYHEDSNEPDGIIVLGDWNSRAGDGGRIAAEIGITLEILETQNYPHDHIVDLFAMTSSMKSRTEVLPLAYLSTYYSDNWYDYHHVYSDHYAVMIDIK